MGGINNSGQITGGTDLPSRTLAFRYTDGIGLEEIGTLFGNSAQGFGINDSGWITGRSGGHAFLFRDDIGMIDLGVGIGRAINNHGVVAGRTGLLRAFIHLNGEMHVLGTLGGSYSAGYGINDYNVVVGESYLDTWLPSRVGAFIWNSQEGMRELNTLISPESDWTLGQANAINEFGQITGFGKFGAFRLDPIPPRMTIGRSGTNVVLSWSPAWPGIELEVTSGLSTPDWQPIATGGSNMLSVSMEEPERFFRLNLEGIRGLCCAPEP